MYAPLCNLIVSDNLSINEVFLKKVILYTMNDCPHCVTAKKFLESREIPYRLCNVKTPHGQKEFLRTRLRSVPAIKVGDQLIAGFNPKQIEKLMKG